MRVAWKYFYDTGVVRYSFIDKLTKLYYTYHYFRVILSRKIEKWALESMFAI